MRGQIVLIVLFVVVFAVGCTIPTGGLNGTGGIQFVTPNGTTNETIGASNETTNETEPPIIPGASDYHDCFDIGNFQYDAHEDDNVNLNDEYITTQNICNESIDMTGWTISDKDGNTYTFPSFILPASAVFILHSGYGIDTTFQLYWCRDGLEVWDNDGDTLYLRDEIGTQYFSYTYPE